jgi:hypothetical protein
MTDTTEAMDNLIAQNADLIEICPDDLAQRLFIEADNFKVDREVGMRAMLYRAADCIEQLEREKAVVSDLWEQQKQIALDYLADCNKAADHIEAQAVEIERLNKSAECLAESKRLAVKDIAALESENERVREALQFYAEAKNWAYVKSAGCNCIDADSGDTARAALEARGLEIRSRGAWKEAGQPWLWTYDAHLKGEGK